MDENEFKPGFIKQYVDIRDYSINSEPVRMFLSVTPTILPTYVDLRDKGIPVMDQKSLGSCTANALNAMVGYFYEKNGKVFDFQGSRLATYYWTRLAMGTTGYDSGASIRGTMKTFAKYGLAKEEYWPYVISNYKKKPSLKVTLDASKRRGIAYVLIDQPKMSSLDIILDIKKQLAIGNVMEFGTYIYSSIFKVKKDGIIPEPAVGETPIGGHAMCIVGYDDEKKYFLIQNSWGTDWGMNGFGWLPYSYFETGFNGKRDACDVWTLTNAIWRD